MDDHGAFPHRVPAEIFTSIVAVLVGGHFGVPLFAQGSYKVFKAIQLVIVGVKNESDVVIHPKTIAARQLFGNAINVAFITGAAKIDALVVVHQEGFGAIFRCLQAPNYGPKFDVVFSLGCVLPGWLIQFTVDGNVLVGALRRKFLGRDLPR